MNGRKFAAIGIILVLLGVQLRVVQTYVLNQKASDFLEKRMKQSPIQSEGYYGGDMLMLAGPVPQKQLTHPRWIGLAFISVGAVLLLHGLTLRKTE